MITSTQPPPYLTYHTSTHNSKDILLSISVLTRSKHLLTSTWLLDRTCTDYSYQDINLLSSCTPSTPLPPRLSPLPRWSRYPILQPRHPQHGSRDLLSSRIWCMRQARRKIKYTRWLSGIRWRWLLRGIVESSGLFIVRIPIHPARSHLSRSTYHPRWKITDHRRSESFLALGRIAKEVVRIWRNSHYTTKPIRYPISSGGTIDYISRNIPLHEYGGKSEIPISSDRPSRPWVDYR
jgi:hypothetical protein